VDEYHAIRGHWSDHRIIDQCIRNGFFQERLCP
jgi:hypothetical protein